MPNGVSLNREHDCEPDKSGYHLRRGHSSDKRAPSQKAFQDPLNASNHSSYTVNVLIPQKRHGHYCGAVKHYRNDATDERFIV